MPISITQQVNLQLAFAKSLCYQMAGLTAVAHSSNQLLGQAMLQGGVGAVYRGLCLYLDELQLRLKEQGVVVETPLVEKSDWLNFNRRLTALVNNSNAPEFSELAVLAESDESWIHVLVNTYLGREMDIKPTSNPGKAGVDVFESIKLVDVEKKLVKIDTNEYLERVIASFEELLQRQREAIQYC